MIKSPKFYVNHRQCAEDLLDNSPSCALIAGKIAANFINQSVECAKNWEKSAPDVIINSPKFCCKA